MKSVIVCPGFHKGSGGPVKTIGAFRTALNADQICFYPRSEAARRPLAFDDVEVVHSTELPVLKHFYFSRATKQAEELCRGASIISCHSLFHYHSLWVNKISRQIGVPYWFVPHGVLDPWVMTYRRLRKHVFWHLGGRRFLREASAVIFSTSRERDKAAAQFEMPHTEVIPWPVSCVDLSARDDRRCRVRERLSIPADAKVLVYFGRLHEMKRPLETIRAVGANRHEKLHLIIIGNEDNVSFQDCMRISKAANVIDRIHLAGPVYGSHKYDYLMAGDAYISLSWRENFNHTAAESLATGLPVILSQGNDIQQDLASARCSWVIQDSSLSSAAKAIKVFCDTDFQELAAMGRRGRDWVQQNLDFTSFAKKLSDVRLRYGKH